MQTHPLPVLRAAFVGAALAFAASGGARAADPAAASISAPATAPDLGPAVGAPIPHALSATDHTGAARDFASLAGPKGLAVYFIRSVDWCPYCKAQTLAVNDARAEFAKRGLNVVFVSYDPVEKQAAFAKTRDIAVTLLSDPKSEIIDAFGLRNEKHKQGRFAGIPHPAAFIVKSDRTIAAKLYETDYLSNEMSYRQRPEVAAVLAAADASL